MTTRGYCGKTRNCQKVNTVALEQTKRPLSQRAINLHLYVCPGTVLLAGVLRGPGAVFPVKVLSWLVENSAAAQFSQIGARYQGMCRGYT